MNSTQTNGHSQRSNYQDRARVQFNAGEPVLVELEFDKGTLTQGRFGDEFRFWVLALLDGKANVPATMWVPPKVALMIESLGAKAGDVLEITKLEKKNGSRKTIEWKVDRVFPTPKPTQAQPAAEMQPEEPEGFDQAPPWETAADPSAGAGALRPVSSMAPAKQFTAPAEGYNYGKTERDRILTCVCNAIDVAQLAGEYARSKGLMIAWTGEDVRAMALSEYITLSKGGAR